MMAALAALVRALARLSATKGDPHRGPADRRLVHDDRAADGLEELPGDRQSESETSGGLGTVEAGERLEDAFAIVRGDAGAGVRDGDGRGVVVGFDQDAYRRAAVDVTVLDDFRECTPQVA